MQKTWLLATLTLLGASITGQAFGQTQLSEEEIRFARRNLSGPRFGMTYIAGSGELQQRLEDEGVGRTVSQFGWHFEWQVVPEGGGPQLVIQAVPLVAGVEYGKFIPSGTLALGVRFLNGFELGLGPNVVVTGNSSSDPATTALVVALGKSIDYGGVSIPLNLAVAHNPEGTRASFIIGYAIS